MLWSYPYAGTLGDSDKEGKLNEGDARPELVALPSCPTKEPELARYGKFALVELSTLLMRSPAYDTDHSLSVGAELTLSSTSPLAASPPPF